MENGDQPSLQDILTDIANSVRRLTGTAEPLSLKDIATALNSIPTVSLGVINDAGEVQTLDLSNESGPVAVGDPEKLDVYIFDTIDNEEPEYNKNSDI